MEVQKHIKLFGYIACITGSVSFNTSLKNLKPIVIKNTKKVTLPTYSPKVVNNLIFEKSETLIASAGTKSVLFNTNMSKLYAMNLEGMSVYEFDQATKKITKEFKFKPTKGFGWDYVKHIKVNSFEEKPVEACFSHNDKLLWVSLHNANGIVPINLTAKIESRKPDSTYKKVYVKNLDSQYKDSMYVPLIRTGKTPKVIAKTANSKYVLVSNWHSNNVSVIEANDSILPYGKLIATIPVSAIPRGIAVDDVNNKTYIAIMGGNSISVINNLTWKIEKELNVAATPRHILIDNKQRLLVSYNSMGKIVCVSPLTGKTLFSTKTNAQPRTIVLSKNQRFLFVTCYSGNVVDVFKINDTSFTKIYSLECKGKPVGVDIYEDDNKLEAWVCNYVGGNIKVFTFKKE